MSRSSPATRSSSTRTERGHDEWQQQRQSRGKKKAQTADAYFQEIAKDIHESNQKIANPYEHEDAEQYNWSFDVELSAEKKDFIKKTKRLIALIKERTRLRITSIEELLSCKTRTLTCNV
jgi:hypothetical protein